MTAIRPLASDICRFTARHFGLKAEDLQGPSPARQFAWPRFVAMHVTKNFRADLSYPQIGRLYGGRDHSSVMHACRRASELAEQHEFIAAAIVAVTDHFSTKAPIE